MFKSLKKKIESDPHQEIHLASNKKPGGPIRLSAATSDDESNETKRCEPNQSLNADEEELARTKDDEEIPEVFVEPKLSDSKNALAIKTKQVEELRTMIGLLEEKIAHLQGEVQSSSRAKDESVVKLEETRGERDELKKRIDDLANEKDEERTSFDERCTNLEKELSDKAKDLECAAVELQKTNEKKTAAEVLNGKLRQEKSKFEEKILALEKRLRETEMTESDQIQCLLQEREQLKKTVAETESLKLQLEDARKTVRESTSRVDDLERQNEREVSSNETLKSQLAEALSVSAERERLIATLQMSISTTLSEEKAAREGLKTEIQTLKQSQAVLKELQKHHEELQSRSVDRERELERIVQERDEAWAERDALKRDSEAQKSVTMTRDRLESTETQQLGVEYDQLLAEANGTYDKSIADKQQTIEELAEQVELLEARIRMQNDSEFSLVNSEHLPEKVTQLRKENSDLKSQLIEKNKAIKMQQQKLTDLKKALHRELKGQDLPDGSRTGQDCHLPNVNSEYLKHVILRFFCSSNEEARQLIKAVSAVLRFTPREERCVIEWLNYKTSWFGSQPKSPIGGIR
ncbi:golgin subfamily A member 1-like isoform X2 [Oscarella lobularis]|uniref:golgin subfamily A member 1-like isoform X2 n=1 Tax=Oscarella lobularis TaxID=121494 RepID=UPI003313A2B6